MTYDETQKTTRTPVTVKLNIFSDVVFDVALLVDVTEADLLQLLLDAPWVLVKAMNGESTGLWRGNTIVAYVSCYWARTNLTASSDLHGDDGITLCVTLVDPVPLPLQPATYVADENGAINFLLIIASCVWIVKIVEVATRTTNMVSVLLSLALISYCDRQYKTLKWPAMYKISQISILVEIIVNTIGLFRFVLGL